MGIEEESRDAAPELLADNPHRLVESIFEADFFESGARLRICENSEEPIVRREDVVRDIVVAGFEDDASKQLQRWQVRQAPNEIRKQQVELLVIAA